MDGYTPMLYSARTPAKARARCYRDYCAAYDSATFHDFLVKSSVRRVDDPPGAHKRILVCGKPATRVIGRGTGIYFMWDGSDEILTCHPMELQEMPRRTGWVR